MKQITIIKYGTAVLTAENFAGESIIDRNIIEQHGAILNSFNAPLVLVSSGAVGLGKTVISANDINADTTTQKRLLAEVGQPLLFSLWQKSVASRVVLQKLVTYADLKRSSTTQTIRAALENNLLYIFNFNDGVDDAELKEDADHYFGDNDHLATEVAVACAPMATNTRLILNTSSDGVMNQTTGEVFNHLTAADLTDDFIKTHCQGTSNGGTGGMASKLHYVAQALRSGVTEAWIINGKNPGSLQSILNGQSAGTHLTLS